MSLPDSFSYDQVPYPSLSHANTHPDNLAIMAILAGLHPTPVEECRLLELGSASGGNLIPMAYGLPRSQFVGIDISGVQIKEGQQKVKDLGLENVRLEQMDILDLPEAWGQFDYIIAHGIFSWVPPDVREKLLDIYRSHLAPNGVGFISYNTYPGWHMIGIARDIMRYSSRGIEDPKERVTAARSALQFFANASPEEKNGYFSFLQVYSDYIEGNTEDKNPKYDSALLHDELEDINQPFYFYQFNEMAEQHGLRFLADLCHYDHSNPPPEVMGPLRKKAKTWVDLEQSLDFVKNRTFRQTLVCQREAPVNRKVSPGVVKNFWIASQARPVSEKPEIEAVSVEQFRGADGATLTTDHPCSKAAMLCLADVWPRSMAFTDLLAAARARLQKNGTQPGDAATDAKVLGVNILRAFGYSSTLVELHTFSPGSSTRIDDRPIASRVARYQARDEMSVTNLRHERVIPDGLERFLLTHLDGTQDRQSLLKSLVEGPLSSGELTVEKEGKPVSAREKPKLLASELEQRLEWLAKASLLIDPTRLGG